MVDLEEIRSRLQGRNNGKINGGTQQNREKATWWKLPIEVGESKVMFLPPVNSGTPGKIQFTHWNVPEVNRLTCLKTFDKTCPICEMIKEFGNKVPEDIIKGYVAQERAVHNVLVLDNPKIPPNQPVVLVSSPYNYWWLLEQILNPDVGDITNINDNHSVIFKRVQRAGKMERSIALKGRPIANTQAEIDDIISKCVDFNKLWVYSEELESNLKVAADAIYQDLSAKMSVVSSLGSNSDAIPEPSQVQRDTQAVENAIATGNIGVKKPADANDCFGSHLDESHPEYNKCMMCSYEIECQEASNG